MRARVQRWGLSALALLLFTVLAGIAPSDAHAQQITLSAGDGSVTSVAPSTNFDLPFPVDMSQAGGENLASLAFTIVWDPAQLTYVDNTAGNFGTVTVNDLQVANGILTVAIFNATGTTSDFDAISVEFQAGATLGNTSIAVQLDGAGNEAGQDIAGLVVTQPLTLCIGTTGLWGDVTGDGQVNIIDAQQIARFSVGLPIADPTRAAAVGDVTEDGQVNVIDAQQIARFSVGLPASPRTGTALPGCSTGPAPVATVVITPDSVDVAEGQQFTFTAELFDANGNLLTGRTVIWTVGDQGVVTIDPVTGTVTAIGPGVENVRATSEGVTDLAKVVVPSAGNLICGALVQGVISQGAQTDQYSLTGSSGDLITLTLAKTGGWSAFGSAPRVTLLAPSGTETANFIGNGQQDIVLPESGTYDIRINANNLVTTGSYSFGYSCILPTDAAAPHLAYGDLVEDALVAAEADLYTFDGTSGEFVTLTMAKTGGWSAFGSAPRATLYAPSGTSVVTFIGHGQENLTLPESGRYVVRINANNFVTAGSYSFGIESLIPATAGSPQLAYGDLITDDIVAAEVDLYTFTGTTGDFVAMTMAKTGGWSAFGSAPSATLYAPSGASVVTFIGHGQQNLTLPEDGLYVVRINANNFVTAGSYSFGIESLIPATAGSPQLSYGDLVADDIVAAEVDLYTFTGTTGEFVALTMAKTGGWSAFGSAPSATLYAPSGASVVTFIGHGQENITLPEDGLYVVRINANNFVTTGSYSFGIESLIPATAGSPQLSYGDLVADDIVAAEVDLYTFTGTTGDFIAMTMAKTGGWSAFGSAPQATLYAPSGASVVTFIGNGQQNITLPEDGLYVVRINANNFVTGGSYSFGIESLIPATAGSPQLAYGDLVADDIVAAEVDLYTFTGTTGDFIAMTMAKTGGWSAFGSAPEATLYAPSGASVVTFIGNGQEVQELPEDGLYVVRVNANNFVTAGSYSFGVEGLSPITAGSPTLTKGPVTAGSLAAAAQVDLYTYLGSAGESLTVTLSKTGGFPAFGSSALITIYSPSRNIVLSFVATDQQSISLPEAGTYVIQVNANNFVSTGTYSLGLL